LVNDTRNILRTLDLVLRMLNAWQLLIMEGGTYKLVGVGVEGG